MSYKYNVIFYVSLKLYLTIIYWLLKDQKYHNHKKKDQKSDIKNTLIVTLKTPGQSQVHTDNRNIQLLLKSSDIFFHLKHWTLTAHYT